jgi:hypothetical protein
MATKPQFANVQQCFRKGNGNVQGRPVLLENLTIRICSRDSGPHMLAKHHLAGASVDAFAFSGFPAIAAPPCFCH